MADTVTGPVAVLGQSAQNGAQLAIDEINDAGGVDGNQLKLVFADSGSTNETAISGTQRVLESDPQAFIGLSLSTQAFAALPNVTKASVPAVTFGTDPKLADASNGIFSGLANVSVLAPAAAKYVVDELGAAKVGVLTTDDQFGISARDALTESLEASGTETVVETVGATATDTTPQMVKFRNEDVDAVITWVLQPLMPGIFTGRQQLGMGDIPFLTAAVLPATLEQITESAIDGVYSVVGANLGDAQQAVTKDFIQAYGDAYDNEAPSEYAAGAYDTVHILATILKAGTVADEVIEGLTQVDYDGVLGKYQADSQGNLAKHAVIAKYDGKTLTTIEAIE